MTDAPARAGNTRGTISGGVSNPAEINDRWLYAMVSLAARESRDKPTGCKAPGARFRKHAPKAGKLI